MRDSEVVAFYKGTEPDTEGRTLEEILAWDDGKLEAEHNYLPWLFPVVKESAFNIYEPLLSKADIRAFSDDETLRERLARAADRMLRFYGLTRDQDKVSKGETWNARRGEWLSPRNHNYNRITRILTCLSVAGLGDLAKGLLTCLSELHEEFPELISVQTINQWRSAIATKQPV